MPKALKYELLAWEIEGLIGSGTYKSGDPLPSVRALGEQKKLSVTTVLKAYYMLEAQGLVEARSRSGFYVSRTRQHLTPEPLISTPDLDPSRLEVQQLVGMLLKDGLNPDVVPLGAAYPDPELSATEKLNRICTAISRKLGNRTGQYDMPPGCLEFREQIARHMVAAGCSLAADDIVTTFGATEAISVCLRAVCRQGDTVAVESPIGMDTLLALELLGLKALEIPTHPRDGISLEALRFAVDNNQVQACLVIPNFNNPLGSLMPDDQKRRLVKVMTERRIPVIEDDVFGDIHFERDRPSTVKSFDTDGWVMLCSSFSKSTSPGYRLGWTAPGRFLSKVSWIKYTSSSACTTLHHLAMADFMAHGGFKQHLRLVRREYGNRVSSLRRAVIRLFPKGIKVTRPLGGFLLWVEMPRSVNALDLYKRALDSGISIAPGHIFSASDRYRNFIRLNAGLWSDELEWAVKRLGRLIAEMS